MMRFVASDLFAEHDHDFFCKYCTSRGFKILAHAIRVDRQTLCNFGDRRCRQTGGPHDIGDRYPFGLNSTHRTFMFL